MSKYKISQLNRPETNLTQNDLFLISHFDKTSPTGFDSLALTYYDLVNNLKTQPGDLGFSDEISTLKYIQTHLPHYDDIKIYPTMSDFPVLDDDTDLGKIYFDESTNIAYRPIKLSTGEFKYIALDNLSLSAVAIKLFNGDKFTDVSVDNRRALIDLSETELSCIPELSINLAELIPVVIEISNDLSVMHDELDAMPGNVDELSSEMREFATTFSNDLSEVSADIITTINTNVTEIRKEINDIDTQLNKIDSELVNHSHSYTDISDLADLPPQLSGDGKTISVDVETCEISLISADSYSKVGHSHSYNTLTDLPPQLSGDGETIQIVDNVIKCINSAPAGEITEIVSNIDVLSNDITDITNRIANIIIPPQLSGDGETISVDVETCEISLISADSYSKVGHSHSYTDISDLADLPQQLSGDELTIFINDSNTISALPPTFSYIDDASTTTLNINNVVKYVNIDASSFNIFNFISVDTNQLTRDGVYTWEIFVTRSITADSQALSVNFSTNNTQLKCAYVGPETIVADSTVELSATANCSTSVFAFRVIKRESSIVYNLNFAYSF